MTLSLSYLSDLSRVRVTLSGLPDGTVQIQRSANASATDAIWARGVVRGGEALPVESGAGQADDHEFFADVTNHYRAVPVDPPAGLLLTGTSGDYASTPDAAVLDITGDLDIRADITPDQWASGGNVAVVAKYLTTGDQRSYMLQLLSDGQLRLIWSPDGTSGSAVTGAAATIPGIVDGQRLAVRVTLDVDNGASGWTATFYTAATIAGGWSQFAEVTDAGVTSIHSGTADLEVGSLNGGTADLFEGVVHAVEVRDGIDGTVVADPDFSVQTAGGASFDDDAGLTWTINGNAELVGTHSANITPDLDGEVWLKSIKYPSLNTPLTISDYGDVAHTDRSGAFAVAGRSLPIGASDLMGGRDHPLVIATRDEDTEAKLEILVRAGGILFVHVPATGNLSLLPGSMYALPRGMRVHRAGGVSDVQLWTLPLTEVAQPRPGVTGTLLTAETLLRLYGSGQALISAHSTGRSLMQTIADPDDVVVL